MSSSNLPLSLSLSSRLNPLSISAWEVNNQIGLHVTVDGKVFSSFSSTLDQSGSRIISMSATDKITHWQVLGFQGALLSHFIEPIYVSSILIGKHCTKFSEKDKDCFFQCPAVVTRNRE